ncbi:hypothetical protein [Pseudofrankia sp. DC12]|uniref:hypothetical protein n=1 Tax=Pseudofrankia sp. DC12 TaxID=683315 RepID=UPI0005F82393|nr:hypothetical protein [Pseudofrankia sp. DC12]
MRIWRPGSAHRDNSAHRDSSAHRWRLSRRTRLVAAIVPVLIVVGGLSGWFAAERTAAARANRKAVLCEVADVVVATPRYPELEQFLAVEWRFLTSTTAGTHDAAFVRLVAGLPARPDPAAMKPVAAYCHTRGLGIVAP